MVLSSLSGGRFGEPSSSSRGSLPDVKVLLGVSVEGSRSDEKSHLLLVTET